MTSPGLAALVLPKLSKQIIGSVGEDLFIQPVIRLLNNREFRRLYQRLAADVIANANLD